MLTDNFFFALRLKKIFFFTPAGEIQKHTHTPLDLVFSQEKARRARAYRVSDATRHAAGTRNPHEAEWTEMTLLSESDTPLVLVNSSARAPKVTRLGESNTPLGLFNSSASAPKVTRLGESNSPLEHGISPGRAPGVTRVGKSSRSDTTGRNHYAAGT